MRYLLIGLLLLTIGVGQGYYFTFNTQAYMDTQKIWIAFMVLLPSVLGSIFIIKGVNKMEKNNG